MECQVIDNIILEGRGIIASSYGHLTIDSNLILGKIAILELLDSEQYREGNVLTLSFRA